MTIAKTADRSVLGCMNDLVLTCRLATQHDGGLADLDLDLDLEQLRHVLQRLIYAARGYVPAIDQIVDYAGRQRAP